MPGFLEKIRKGIHARIRGLVRTREVIVREVYSEPASVLSRLRDRAINEGARVVVDEKQGVIRIRHGRLRAYKPEEYFKEITIRIRKEGIRSVLRIVVDVTRYVRIWLLIDAIAFILGGYLAYSGLVATLYVFNIFKGLPQTPTSELLIKVAGTSFLLDMTLFTSGLIILFGILDIYPTLSALKFGHNWIWDLIDGVKEELEGRKHS